MRKIEIFKITVVLLSMTFIVCQSASSQIAKQTYIYAIKSGDTLRLDKYVLSNDTSLATKPCLIFMFGGGFVGGQRDNEFYETYFNRMAQDGYVVVSIDYRLGLKPLADKMRQGKNVKKTDFPKFMGDAIDTAVVDLYSATNFVLEHAEEWQVDSSKIIANGSSAGAISVLQSEYYICNGSHYTKELPPDFNFAGVISFAGAIFTSQKVHWKHIPAPMMFFHGNADSNVPYDKMRFLKYRFTGSKAIVKDLKNLNASYYFYDAWQADHAMAGKPMNDNLREIREFIRKFVIDKQPLEIYKFVKNTWQQHKKTRFTVKDYISSNFRPATVSE